MTIIVTGASGLLGSGLVRALEGQGEEVVRLVRRAPSGPAEARWDPEGTLDPAVLEGARAVIHLAGAPIADKRWSTPYKKELIRSRILGTRTLVTAINRLDDPPEVLVSASGVDFYGDTGGELVDESHPRGEGFLAELCERWEGEARQANVRNAQLRTTLALSGRGGALARMLPIFKVGMGAPLGNGRQYWSWIAEDDWIQATIHILKNREISGAVNLASPHPVTNAEFTRTLGKALGRGTMPIPTPAFALTIALGEFARAGLLPSHRILPKKLVDSGYGFLHTRLDEALTAVL